LLGLSRSKLHENDNKKSPNHISNDAGKSENDYPIKLIYQHKCTYCHADFKNEKEWEKHELKWHI
jgi:hypothetical protein